MNKLLDKIPRLFLKFAKFGTIGVINTVIDFAVFSLFLSGFGLTAEISQACGYIAGTINSFIMNRRFTYNKRGVYESGEMIKFIIVNAISLCASVACMWLLTSIFRLNEYFAKILVICVTQAINFSLYTIWVFTTKQKNRQDF